MVLFHIPKLLSFTEREIFCNQWDDNHLQCENVVKIFDVVRGYHNFHMRPAIGNIMELELVREPDNRYDMHAVKVMAPVISKIQPQFYENVTRERDGQKVRDVAGNCVGRVPAHLCQAISVGLASGQIKAASAYYTGHVITGRGNGPELSAVYFLEMRSEVEKDKLEDNLLSEIKSLIRDVYLSNLM